jgi:putative MATE family efflux protein
MNNRYLIKLRNGEPLSFKESMIMILTLSFPAILAQLSSVVMQYIDSAMVGRLGVHQAASIALMSSTTWLFSGICTSIGIGFVVKIAHDIGAKEDQQARNLVKIGLLFLLAVSLVLLVIGILLSRPLPVLLGGGKDIVADATKYFFVYSLSMPAVIMVSGAGGMLQGAGIMKLPSFLNVMMCGLDVIFNALLIFPSGTFGYVPTAGLGVLGAAMGTAFSQLVTAACMLVALLFFSPLKLTSGEHFSFRLSELTGALNISLPVVFESIVMSGAYILSTRIVAPLGTLSIATHSFAVTVESLCYMPGYGLESAATTIIGQSLGARRVDLTKRFGYMAVFLGMSIMGAMAILLYLFAPFMLGLLTPNYEIIKLGTRVLRLEAFVEIFYGASIVADGVFKGAGDTLIPSFMTLFSMWLVRLPAAFILSHHFGLFGIWMAMASELVFRGIIFLIRLFKKSWLKNQ